MEKHKTQSYKTISIQLNVNITDIDHFPLSIAHIKKYMYFMHHDKDGTQLANVDTLKYLDCTISHDDSLNKEIDAWNPQSK